MGLRLSEENHRVRRMKVVTRCDLRLGDSLRSWQAFVDAGRDDLPATLIGRNFAGFLWRIDSELSHSTAEGAL